MSPNIYGEGRDPSGMPFEVANLNAVSASKVDSVTQLMCGTLIEAVSKGIAIHLQYDQEAHDAVAATGYAPGQKLPYYVQTDFSTAPQHRGDLVETASIRVEPRVSGSEGFVAKLGAYMCLHIPTYKRALPEYEAPEVDEVVELFIEVGDGTDDLPHWYAVSRRGLHEYVPSLRQNGPEEFVLDDAGIWQWMNTQVPETMQTAGRLLTDTINWETVPQRVHIYEEITEA